jgi:hypothetical protein
MLERSRDSDLSPLRGSLCQHFAHTSIPVLSSATITRSVEYAITRFVEYAITRFVENAVTMVVVGILLQSHAIGTMEDATPARMDLCIRGPF